MTGPSRSKHILINVLMPIIIFLILISNHAFSTQKSSTVINNLTNNLKSITRKHPALSCGIYIKPSWLKEGINLNGTVEFPAASLIKIPIAVILLQEIDKGNIKPDSYLTLKKQHLAGGSGVIRNMKIGSKVKLLDVFRLMLKISDNTATNMIIDFLGGVDSCNSKISRLGLRHTKLLEPIGLFSKEKNRTSPLDLVTLLENSLEKNHLLSSSSRKLLKKTLLRVKNKSLINKGLGPYTKFAHKTGSIGICIGDSGIIYLPFGKRIGISIIVKRPFNDLRGNKIIREISKLVYQELG